MKKTFNFGRSLALSVLFIPFQVSAENGLYIHENGNVGVGLSTPTNGRLEIAAAAGGEYSIYSHGTIHAVTYCNSSDQRIKNTVGLTNNEQDLATLLNIQITDYHYLDPKKSDIDTKKLIGQQLRQVYPQSVRLGKGMINDIMTTASMSANHIFINNHG